MNDSTVDSTDLRESVEGGVSPALLANMAPSLELAVEALTYEYGRMAQVSKNAANGEQPDYWKGRMDAYATVRGELIGALMRYESIEDYPLLEDELGELVHNDRTEDDATDDDDPDDDGE